MSIPGTSRDVIFSVFERVERRFGWQFVNHALGYITAGKHGISEPELLDILSCDEKVSTVHHLLGVPWIRSHSSALAVHKTASMITEVLTSVHSSDIHAHSALPLAHARRAFRSQDTYQPLEFCQVDFQFCKTANPNHYSVTPR